MANDLKFRIVLEGDDREALAKIDKVVKDLNDAKAATTRYGRERQRLAREERQARFSALSDEEKRNRLLQRQVNLERQLSRARSSGNLSRISALELSMARNRSSQRSVGPAGGGGIMGLAARGLGALGIGVSIAGVAHGLAGIVTSSLRFADELGDLSEQADLTRIQMLKLQKAAGASGVSTGAALAGMSTFAAFRSSVVGGDENAQNIAAKYGMLGRMRGPEDNLALALGIRQALGPNGMQTKDRNNMGAMFGRNPGRMMAVLGSYGSSPLGDEKALDEKLRNLDEVNRKFEDAMMKWKLIMVGMTDTVFAIASKLMNAYSSDPRFQALKLAGSMVGSAYSTFFANSNALPLSPEATARKLARIKRQSDAKAAAEEAKLKGQQSLAMSIPQADSLARIGLYRGGIDVQRVDLMRQQVIELKQIREATKQTATNINRIF